MCWTAIPARDAAVAERVAKRDQHLLVGSVAVVPHDSKIGPRDAEAVDGVGFRSVQPVGDRCGRGRGRWNWGSGSRTLGCCIWTPVGRVRAWLVICARRIGPGYYRGLILLRRGARRTGSRRVGRSGRQPTRRGGGAWFGAPAGLRPVGTCSTGTLARGGPRCRCGFRCSGRNRLRARVGGGGRGRDHQHDESDGGGRRRTQPTPMRVEAMPARHTFPELTLWAGRRRSTPTIWRSDNSDLCECCDRGVSIDMHPGSCRDHARRRSSPRSSPS